MNLDEIRHDLLAEQDALDVIVGGLTDDQWALPTPSPGWSIADQIAHLTYFDGTAALAIDDADAFRDQTAALLSELAPDDPEAMDNATIGAYRTLQPAELLARWRRNRELLDTAAATLADDARVPWYGPSMGAKSFLTARLMETWAHGQDIVDTVAVTREPTVRLRHIAQLGFITRGWTYANRGIEQPSVAVRVELTAPGDPSTGDGSAGKIWRFGPDDAPESIVGPAEDFCLVATQRRHVDDTALVVTGASARDWMEKAQLFAGAPTDGPAPRHDDPGGPDT